MLDIHVKNERQDQQWTLARGTLAFGRHQQHDEPGFVIDDPYVSRNQMRIEQTGAGCVRIENLGGAISLDDGTTIEKGETREVVLPLSLTAGYTRISLRAQAAAPDPSLQTIDRAPQEARKSVMRLGDVPSPDELTTWFETLLAVQHAAAGSTEFYEETARAVVQLVGLDRGMVILRTSPQRQDWEVRASFAEHPAMRAEYSSSVLARVLDQKRTFYETPMGDDAAASLSKVEAYVAAPILDSDDEIVGVVFGSRDLRDNIKHRGIRPLEAQVVQLLAAAVSAGLARLDREAEVARIRVQFEQFVSPELAHELERNPRLLEAQEREVTVLFMDLRGFSRISERLGARQTYRLLSDAMDRLSNRILESKGYIIDFQGDGIAAVWNAPLSQVDHADLACRTAVAMQQELPELNAQWRDVLGMPLRIGVGINSGVAQVGNAGSQRRIKYGPCGHTVNLAARIEGATKRIGVPILISDATFSQLQQPLPTRRLCQVQMVGVKAPVRLYEVHSHLDDADWAARCAAYDRALRLFESQDLDEAASILEQFGGEQASDRPTQILASLITGNAGSSSDAFDPVLKLDGK